MVEKRVKPRVWVTWLAAYLSGDEQCDWKLWFKSHHIYSRPPRDLAEWETQHNEMVRQCASDLEAQGFSVNTEKENEFTIEGKQADLAGKPDIIARKGTTVLVIDCKTGNEKSYHKVQVLLYLWCLSKNQKYRGATLRGEVQYKGGRKALIGADQLTEEFQKRLRDVMSKVVGAQDPPQKKPSPSECRFCDVPQEWCQYKVSMEPDVIKTDLF